MTDLQMKAAQQLLKALDELANEAHRNMVGGAGHLIDNAWRASAEAKVAGIALPPEDDDEPA